MDTKSKIKNMKIVVDEMPVWSGEGLFCKDEWIGSPCMFTDEHCALWKDEKCEFLIAIKEVE